MVVSTETEYRGRKQKVGTPVFSDTGRLMFFIGYCPDCHGKCMVTTDEAKRLMRMFYKRRHRPGQRLVLKALKRYSYDG